MRIVSFDVGVKNLAFVEMNVLPEQGIRSCKIDRWEVVDVLDGRQVKKVSFEETVRCVLEFLEDSFEACDVVLIENQPCIMNPRLKSVQMVIYTYFCTMNIVKCAYPDVRLLPASGKLQGLRNAPVGLIPVKASTMTYAQKKLASIVACEHYLEHVFDEKTKVGIFASAKGKRDDLADCLLQAVAYVERLYPEKVRP